MKIIQDGVTIQDGGFFEFLWQKSMNKDFFILQTDFYFKISIFFEKKSNSNKMAANN
jgi:hypothetical protein